MATRPRAAPPKPSRWGIFGLITVVTALGLSAAGIVLALNQVRSTTVRIMTQAKLRAGQIAAQAADRAQDEIDGALRSIADRSLRPGPRRDLHVPQWVTGVMLFRDGSATVLLTPPEPDTVNDLAARLAARPAPSFGLRLPNRTELHFTRVAGEPVVVAWYDTTDANSRPVTLAITIDSSALADVLLGPTLAADEALELAPATQTGGPWDQPVPGALKHWSIRPADAFIIDQENSFLAQTLIHIGLSSMALIAVLLTMWMLTRAVRREVSLAELKSNFVADVSHELKTPLALIRLYAETLQSGRVPTEEKRREYYDIITRESTRLTNLINNILDFARIEAGRKEYELQSIDPAEVIRQTYEAYRPQLEHAGFEHQLTLAPDLPRIDADKDAISQVLVNLINNAIKYSAEDKFLHVDVATDVRRGRGGILISVHDRGIGIRPEDRAYLTEGFYRARDPHVRQQGGTGLGLALVRHIVEIHGGSLDVETRLVKGSTFRVFLPATSVPAA